MPSGFAMLRDLRDMPADGDFFQCGDRPPEGSYKWNPFYTPKAVSCDFGSFPLSFAAATGGMFVIRSCAAFIKEGGGALIKVTPMQRQSGGFCTS